MRPIRTSLVLVACACGPAPATTSYGSDRTTSASGSESEATLTEPTLAPTADPTSSPTAGSDSDSDPPNLCTDDSDCPELTQICIDGVCQEDPEICGHAPVIFVPYTPPRLMMVLDKSTSMFAPENYWDDDGDDADDDGFVDQDPMQMATPKVARWHTVRELVTAVDNSQELLLGATVFPSLDAVPSDGPEGCITNLAPEFPAAPENAEHILAGLPAADATGFGGGSPATQALQTAYTYLLQQSGPNYPIVVLVTDGVPNCESDTPPDQVDMYDPTMISTIAQPWASHQLPTYVVGIDISHEHDEHGVVAHDVLNEAALAGGVPSQNPSQRYLRPHEFIDAIEPIAEPSFTCVIELQDLQDYDSLQIVVAGQWWFDELDPQADCQQESGFIVDPQSDPFTLTLCGEACTLTDEHEALDIIFRCEQP